MLVRRVSKYITNVFDDIKHRLSTEHERKKNVFQLVWIVKLELGSVCLNCYCFDWVSNARRKCLDKCFFNSIDFKIRLAIFTDGIFKT